MWVMQLSKHVDQEVGTRERQSRRKIGHGKELPYWGELHQQVTSARLARNIASHCVSIFGGVEYSRMMCFAAEVLEEPLRVALWAPASTGHASTFSSSF